MTQAIAETRALATTDAPSPGRGEIDTATLWLVIILLGLVTFALRSGPVLLDGVVKGPRWAARALRYVPAAVMPAIAGPLIAFEKSGALREDPVRWAAIAVTLVVGYLTRSILWTIFAGLGALWAAAGVSALL